MQAIAQGKRDSIPECLPFLCPLLLEGFLAALLNKRSDFYHLELHSSALIDCLQEVRTEEIVSKQSVQLLNSFRNTHSYLALKSALADGMAVSITREVVESLALNWDRGSEQVDDVLATISLQRLEIVESLMHELVLVLGLENGR